MYAILAAIVQLLIFFVGLNKRIRGDVRKKRLSVFLRWGFKKLQKEKLISKQAEYRIERRAIWLSSLG